MNGFQIDAVNNTLDENKLEIERLTDIVERLRGDKKMSGDLETMLHKAAAEIERLQGLLAYGTDTDAYRQLRAENARLKAMLANDEWSTTEQP